MQSDTARGRDRSDEARSRSLSSSRSPPPVTVSPRPGDIFVTLATVSSRLAPLEIISVESSRDLRRFVDLPWKIYNHREHPQWVPPLRIAVRDALDRRNQVYATADRQLFLALRNGTPVGRIAAIENRAHNDFHADRVGFFGFFESNDDPDVAAALFGAAEKWLAARGLDTMRGPVNPSTNHECGLLVGGFDAHPMIMTTWNPPYYGGLFEAQGFAKAKDLLA